MDDLLSESWAGFPALAGNGIPSVLFASFPFLSLPLVTVVSPQRERESPSNCRTCGRTDPHLTPLPSTSSATCTVTPGSTAFSDVQSTHFQVQRWVVLSGVLVCVQKCFCLIMDVCFMDLISCKLKGGEKRNDSCHHDVDVT